MSTLEKLNAQRMQYKKDGLNKLATLLSTVLGDFQNRMSRPGAGDQESELQGVLRYFLKNVRQFKTDLEKSPNGKSDGRYQDLLAEETALEAFLPKQMSDDELRAAIAAICADENLTTAKDKGKLMGALKAKYAGLYDGAIAAKLAGEALSN